MELCDNFGKVMEPARFRFGLYEFDARTRELRREGALVRLQAQPAQVLGRLIERAGQVVSREELREALWGADTFVDFERGLNFCMSQVRSALNDDSSNPTYIRTIPRQGYQFIAPLQRIPMPAAEQNNSGASAPNRRRIPVMTLALAAGILVAVLLLTAYRLRSKQSVSMDNPPIVAVLRFDNETGNPALDRFSDALTDNVVEQLTSVSQGHYGVIGNARILRESRDQRDLKAIASSLHATYVVLGQVQSGGDQLRILAHLIRVPEQTHIQVVRMDRALAQRIQDDPLGLEAEAAHKIAAQFSPLVASDARQAVSQPPAKR
jgi:DNA-binding winged helix-turn-helix (wHTH) protein/TolB-like protein